MSFQCRAEGFGFVEVVAYWNTIAAVSEGGVKIHFYDTQEAGTLPMLASASFCSIGGIRGPIVPFAILLERFKQNLQLKRSPQHEI